MQPGADCGLPGWDVGWELALPFQGGCLAAALQVPARGSEGITWVGGGCEEREHQWQERSEVSCVPDDTVQAADLLVGARRLVLIG